MPIVVNPSFQWPPEVEPVSSPDGKLTAIVDPAHAGVLLRANFDDSVPDTPAQPEKVLRRNLAADPSFESGTDGWVSASNTTMTVDTSWSGSGARSIKLTPNSSGNGTWLRRGSNSVFPPEMTPGRTYTVSGTIRLAVPQSGSLYGNARGLSLVAWKGGSISARVDVPSAPNAAGAFRVSGTMTVPADANGFEIRLLNGGTNSADNSVWWDNIVIEEGATSGTYFDGSTPTSGTKRYRWTGAPNASTSEEYTPATPFIPGKPGTVAKVRFERQDGSLVRSGNPAWAPGGYAHAYDHEATLGGGTMWRAVPIRYDGTEGTPSDFVTVVIPGLSDGWAWLKPVTDPDKAMLLKVEPPDLDYNGRLDTTSIAGSPHPAATWDVLEGFTTQLRSLVRDKLVADQLMALLDEGPVLAQFPKCAGLPDFYFLRGKLSLEHVHWDGYPWRRYQWDVVRVHRPDTTDTPLRIPGLSYDTVERDWTTYDQLKTTVTSYNKLLEP